MCLVLFWKCYFPTNFLHFLSYFLSIQTNFITENFKIIAKSQSTAKYPSLVTTNNNPQPPKFIPTTETTPHTTETPIQPTTTNSGNQKPQSTASKQNPQPHNRKTTKKTPPTPPQQQQKSKSHKNQNHTQREIGLWVSGEVEGSGSKISGSKALALGRRLWVCGMIWALGMWVKSKTSSWVRGAKSLGRQRSWSSWVASNGLSLLPLSLSLSLRAGTISLSLSHSLFSRKWYLKVK